MTQTKAGRDPEGALKEIEAQAQEPAGPQAALAAWQERMTELLNEFPPVGGILAVRAHLAAMPQAQPDAALAKAQGERDFWRRSYQEQITILENLDPRMDGTEDLLKALREIDKIGALLYPDGADVMDDNPFAGQVSEMWRIAAAAIAQAKKGEAK